MTCMKAPCYLVHPDDHFYYGVRIITGDQEDVDSSSDTQQADCWITLIGNRATSTVITIHTVKNEDLILECSDSLGEVEEIVLEHKSTEIHARVYDFQEQVTPSTAAEIAQLSSTSK